MAWCRAAHVSSSSESASDSNSSESSAGDKAAARTHLHNGNNHAEEVEECNGNGEGADTGGAAETDDANNASPIITDHLHPGGGQRPPAIQRVRSTHRHHMCCSVSGSSGASGSSSATATAQLQQEQWRRCGLCTLVARAFRRAVCGSVAASRRGSNESYQKVQTAAATGEGAPASAEAEGGDGKVSGEIGPGGREGGDTANVQTIAVDIGKQVYIKMTGPTFPGSTSPITPSSRSPSLPSHRGSTSAGHPVRCLSPEDWVLLDAMSTYGRQMGADQVPCGGGGGGGGSSTSSTGDGVAVVVSHAGGTCSGRFLTMHKRRRKRLMTRSLQADGAMLDDVHHGQVQRILDRCGLWGFNAFTLETVAGGRSLPVLCVHLFHWYGLLDHFRLDVVRVWKLFTLIEEGYHSTNPYHNSIHATDVTQAMHCFLQEEKIRQHVTPVEIMAALIGAVAHDLDHPGVNQHFLISTSNHLAILYENRSVLENHHWRSALGCLLESGVADQVVAHRPDLEAQIRELILATDINRQQEFITKFRNHLDEDTLDLTIAENRQFILQIALKCADISNPTRPWDISHKWSLKVCDEFFRQGNFERKLNLPVTSICDQQSTTVAKIQSGFFKYVVTPLFSEWHRFCASNLSTHMMRQLEANRQRWETQEQAEEAARASAAAAAVSDSGELSDEPVSDVVISEDEDATRKDSTGTTTGMEFMSPPSLPRDSGRRQSLAVPTLAHALGTRRHSVPVNLDPLSPTQPTSAAPVPVHTPGTISGPLPRTIYRRESLPAGRGMPPVARTSPVPSEGGRISSGGLREESEVEYARFAGSRGGSIASMVSSSPGGSGVLYSAMDDDPTTADDPDRPLSAENLLPEPSIASMTAASGALPVGRISSVLQGTASAQASRERALTRQQTFPPPQPYVRVRYMSATAEMSTCKETVHEDDSRSASPTHSHTSSHTSPIPPHSLPLTAVPQKYQHIPSIAVLSPSSKGTSSAALPPQIVLSEGTPPANQSGTTFGEGCGNGGNGNGGCGSKREQQEQCGGGKTKLVKLGEKENVDPRRFGSATSSLSKRRSSAPLNLPIMQLPDDKNGGMMSSAGRGLYSTGAAPADSHHALRRGSVPIEITRYKLDDETSSTTSSTTTAATTVLPPVENPYALWRHQQRRGSAPSDLPPPGPHTTGGLERKEILLLTRHTSLNGKHRRGTGGSGGGNGGGSANGNKKQPLRRRSSGGPETVCLAEVISTSEGVSAAGNLARLLQQRRGTVDVGALAAAAGRQGSQQGEDMTLLARRRGSLPIEVLSVGNSVF